MKALVAGGANVLKVGENAYQFRIGERNAAIVKNHLKAHKISILKEDLGGENGRKMRIALRNFEMKIKMLPNGRFGATEPWR